MISSRLYAMFVLVFACVGVISPNIMRAQTAPEQPAGQITARAPKYSPEVVEKAAKILKDAGLQRSGKTIRATNTIEVSRAMTALTRQRRELRKVYEDWKQAGQQAVAIRADVKRLDARQGELNLQLARVAAGDVTTNNKIVGLIEATRAQMRHLSEQADRAKTLVAERRAALSELESKYADVVLAIRNDFNAARDQLMKVSEDEKVTIALRVMHSNFETPTQVSVDKILAPLNKRIEKIEQEVFSESVPLDVQSGSLYVDVVISRKLTKMVVDSGATMITLPSKTADQLGIQVPANARRLELRMANGDSIPARLVTLPVVRVGEFEAEKVDAAVLDPAAVGAEPLLGMSYLQNFKFEIDAADKSLKMLRVVAE